MGSLLTHRLLFQLEHRPWLPQKNKSERQRGGWETETSLRALAVPGKHCSWEGQAACPSTCQGYELWRHRLRREATPPAPLDKFDGSVASGQGSQSECPEP